MLWNTLSNAHHESDLRGDGLFNTRRRDRRRHEDGRRLGARLLHGLGDIGEDGFAEVGGACFFRVGAADDVGAVFDGLLGVEGTLFAGEALEEHARFAGELEVDVGGGVAGWGRDGGISGFGDGGGGGGAERTCEGLAEGVHLVSQALNGASLGVGGRGEVGCRRGEVGCGRWEVCVCVEGD